MARSLTPAQRKRQTIGPVPVVQEDDAFSTGGKPTDKPSENVGGIAGARLRSFIERIERVKEEIRAGQEDVRGIKAEAKYAGFDVKVINHLIKIRQQDADDLAEFESLVDIYKREIGMKS